MKTVFLNNGTKLFLFEDADTGSVSIATNEHGSECYICQLTKDGVLVYPNSGDACEKLCLVTKKTADRLAGILGVDSSRFSTTLHKCGVDSHVGSACMDIATKARDLAELIVDCEECYKASIIDSAIIQCNIIADG